MIERHDYDAIVIGGGPAGSSAAATLALRGRRVAQLEKEPFPRYHIGESLLPYCYYTFERIGVLERMKASHFIKKYSVQFVRTDGTVSAPFYFDYQLKHPAHQTWQVLRSEFDQMLFDNARQKGAETFQPMKAVDFISDGPATDAGNGHGNGSGQGHAVRGVRAIDAEGREHEFRAPITIDATGRDSLAIAKHSWRMRDPSLNKIAIWTYYRGARRDAGRDEGATTVAYVPEKGWFWYIPQHDNMVSVGIVAERDYLYEGTRDLEEIFLREVEKNRWIKEHLATGRRVEPMRVTGEYSYRSRHCAADGLVLAGDAFAFLDPVFSSGVMLALRSGELAAEAAHGALEAGDVSAARFQEYGETVCYGIESMRKLVYAFYDRQFSFSRFLRKHPAMQGDMTDCLMGNLFIDFGPLFAAVEEFARVPEPLAHGRPLPAGGARALL